MKQRTILFSSLALVFGISLAAKDSQAACIERRDRVGEARVEMKEPDPGRCWLLLGPDYQPNLRYRSYILDESGLIMVFNSYGPGPDSQTTGAREFYVFPRGTELNYRINGDQAEVIHPSGVEFSYDIQTLRWTGAKGATITEAQELRSDNEGGVEIAIQKGLLLDFGFKMGGAPTGVRSGRAVFSDAFGNRCQVSNSDVISWGPDAEPELKFNSDAEVFAFVKARCKSLKY